MKIAVFSDLHANGAALDAFCKDAQEKGVTDYWFLGDAVGYGPDPVKALDWVLSNVSQKRRVWGNHDMMLHGLLAAKDPKLNSKLASNTFSLKFKGDDLVIIENLLRKSDWQATNADAIQIILEHCRELSSEDQLYRKAMKSISRDRRVKHFSFRGVQHWFVHGAIDNLRDNYRYIFPWKEPYLELELLALKKIPTRRNQIHWSGHTHIPMLMVAGQQDEVPKPVFYHYGEKYSVDFPYVFINPGSLGFPRDLDGRCSYVLYYPQDNAIEFQRIEYPQKVAYDQMRAKDYSSSILTKFRDASFPGRDNEFKDHFMKLKEEDI